MDDISLDKWLIVGLGQETYKTRLHYTRPNGVTSKDRGPT